MGLFCQDVIIWKQKEHDVWLNKNNNKRHTSLPGPFADPDATSPDRRHYDETTSTPPGVGGHLPGRLATGRPTSKTRSRPSKTRPSPQASPCHCPDHTRSGHKGRQVGERQMLL